MQPTAQFLASRDPSAGMKILVSNSRCDLQERVAAPEGRRGLPYVCTIPICPRDEVHLRARRQADRGGQLRSVILRLRISSPVRCVPTAVSPKGLLNRSFGTLFMNTVA